MINNEIVNLELWWKELSSSWKNIFKSELDIDKNPSLSDLKRLICFQRIDCSSTAITSLEPLSVFQYLKILICSNTSIKHLDKIASHSKIEEIDCSKTKIFSLLPLVEMKSLKKLDCSYTKIQSLDGLQELAQLEKLSCISTAISSIEPIRHSSKLSYLNIAKTNVNSIDPVIPLLETEQLIFLAQHSPADTIYESFISKKEEDLRRVDIGNRDELFEVCARLIVQTQSGSTSNLQRRLNLGYNRAGRIMDQIEAAGIIGPAKGSSPREVYIKTEAELEVYL
jgi:Leucine-rich repeat (LRR) protein